MAEVTILQDLTEVLANTTVGSQLGITIIVDGNEPVNKKCYKWDTKSQPPMMVRCPCDEEHDGEIEYN